MHLVMSNIHFFKISIGPGHSSQLHYANVALSSKCIFNELAELGITYLVVGHRFFVKDKKGISMRSHWWTIFDTLPAR